MKKVLYVLCGIAVLYLVLAMIGPSKVQVEREITINKPVSMVMEKLPDFVFFHDKWSPWTSLDPSMKVDYKGTPGQAGHSYEWSGNKDVGEGKMELAAVRGDSVVQNLYFGKDGKMGMANAYLIGKDTAGATKLKWQMKFDVGFFHRPMMLFMSMDKMMGPLYEKGLASLKKEIEENGDWKAEVQYDIKEQQWEEKTFASSKRSKMSGEQCGPFFAENFPKMMGDLQKNKIEPKMAPSAIFYSWDDNTKQTECAAVFQVPAGKELKGWEKCTIPASKVLHIAYYGGYDKIYSAHMALENHIKEKGLTKDLVVEEYITDPMTEKDTAKWLTNIYYVLK